MLQDVVTAGGVDSPGQLRHLRHSASSPIQNSTHSGCKVSRPTPEPTQNNSNGLNRVCETSESRQYSSKDLSKLARLRGGNQHNGSSIVQQNTCTALPNSASDRAVSPCLGITRGDVVFLGRRRNGTYSSRTSAGTLVSRQVRCNYSSSVATGSLPAEAAANGYRSNVQSAHSLPSMERAASHASYNKVAMDAKGAAYDGILPGPPLRNVAAGQRRYSVVREEYKKAIEILQQSAGGIKRQDSFEENLYSQLRRNHISVSEYLECPAASALSEILAERRQGQRDPAFKAGPRPPAFGLDATLAAIHSRSEDIGEKRIPISPTYLASKGQKV